MRNENNDDIEDIYNHYNCNNEVVMNDHNDNDEIMKIGNNKVKILLKKKQLFFIIYTKFCRNSIIVSHLQKIF
jgi:hypothetical protein